MYSNFLIRANPPPIRVIRGYTHKLNFTNFQKKSSGDDDEDIPTSRGYADRVKREKVEETSIHRRRLSV